MTTTLVCRTRSPKATVALGVALGRGLRPGDLLLLEGDLGAGKTTLARGVAIGLGAPEDIIVRSPTFTLAQEYDLPIPLLHADLYRIDNPDETEDLGLFGPESDTKVTLIEWGERLPQKVRQGAMEITLEERDESTRRLTIQNASPPVLLALTPFADEPQET